MKKTKWILGLMIALCFSLSSLSLVSCSDDDNDNNNETSIIGMWEYRWENDEKEDYPIIVQFYFKPNGKFELKSWEGYYVSYYPDRPMAFSVSGTWFTSDNRLYLDIEEKYGSWEEHYEYKLGKDGKTLIIYDYLDDDRFGEHYPFVFVKQ